MDLDLLNLSILIPEIPCLGFMQQSVTFPVSDLDLMRLMAQGTKFIEGLT